ncbi:AAA family ATPase [Escherichia coli]|nr:AAA family ATPase [Escherichia coli]
MRSAGVDAQTLASFLRHAAAGQRSGETPDFSNTLFLLDESSMVGNTDMARAYALIAAGGGRAVASGDTGPAAGHRARSAFPSPADAQCCRCGHHERDCASTPELSGGGIQPD